MKYYYIIFMLTIGWANAHAQNSLMGKVVDQETNETLIGASVYFPDVKKGEITDQEGLFKINDLPSGKFLVEVRYVGYAILVEKVEIVGETIIDFALEVSHKELHEVVVTGVSASTEKAINPIQTMTINNVALTQNASTNIIDAISNKPGISQITTGAAISKPVIRGLGFNRVVVLQDNIRQEGQQWGDEHGIEIDEFSIDRVEIIKGPGSLIYGSDAMAGVINFLPPNPIELGKIQTNFTSAYHSNSNLQGYSLNNAGNLKGIYWLVRGTKKLAGNYANVYDGKVYNSGFRETNLNGTVGVTKKWGYVQIDMSTFRQTLGLIEGERDERGKFTKSVIVSDSLLEEQTVSETELKAYKIGIPRQNVRHHRASFAGKFFIGRSQLDVIGGWQQNHRKEFEFHHEEVQNKTTVEEENSLYFLLNTFTYRLMYRIPEWHGWETSFGVNGMKQTNSNKGEEFLIPEYSLWDTGIFAVTTKSFEKLYISGGLRYNWRTINSSALLLDEEGEPTTKQDLAAETKFDHFKNSFDAIAGSIGASYHFKNKFIAKLNISNGFRAPNIAELASNGAHEGTFRYEIGDHNLKPETSLQIDFGVSLNNKHISLEVAAFHNAINDYVFSQKLSSVSGGDSFRLDSGDELSVFRFVQSNANLVGGEVTVDIHPHPFDWLHFENSFSIVRGVLSKQPDSTRYLPFMPAPKFQSEVKAQFPKIGKVFRNFYVNVKLDYFFTQDRFYSAYGTETGTPSYSLLHAGFGSDVVNRKGRKLFSVNFAATNLLNVAYQNHLSRLKYGPINDATQRAGVYNTGQNFTVKLMVPILIKK